MTDSGYRHIVLVIDRSGSIASVLSDMQGGFDQFIKEQRTVPVRTTVTLWQFDTQHDEVCSFTPIADMPEYEIVPRGGTALLDAVGMAIARTGETLAGMPEDARPGNVIVLIATDGHENSSREYTKAQVKALITEQAERYGWEFVYNGANQDSFAEAGSMGISTASTVNWAATPAGTQGSWAAASTMMARGATSGTYAYTDKERSQARGQ